MNPKLEISDLKLHQVFVYSYYEDTENLGMFVGKVVNKSKGTIISDIFAFNDNSEPEIDFTLTNNRVLQVLSDKDSKMIIAFYNEDKSDNQNDNIKMFFLDSNPEYFI